MSGVFCDRCRTKVILEQDERSCSNCHAELIPAKPKPRAAAKPTTPTPTS